MSHDTERWWSRIGAALGLCACLPGALGADLFVKFEKAPGDSKDAKHPKWIEAKDYSVAMQVVAQNRTVQVMTSASVRLPVGRTSPLLMFLLATGESPGKTEFEWIGKTPTGEPGLLYRAEYSGVQLRSVSVSGDGEGASEEVTFQYRTLTFVVPLFKEGTPDPGAASVTVDPGAAVLLSGVLVKGERAADGNVTLKWAAEAGRKYRILSGQSVDGDFSVVQEVTAAATSELGLTLPPTGDGQFFRVLVLN